MESIFFPRIPRYCMRAFVAAIGIIYLVAAFGGLAIAEPVADGPEGVETDVENTSQTIEIRLQENGDANISIYKQFLFDNEEERDAFERLAADFENNTSDTELSVAVFERLAGRASNETGREMGIESVTRNASATESTGTLELQFTWTNFANTTDDRLDVGDAFVIDGRMWLPSLSADQRLIIRAPEGYAVENASTSVTNGTLIWTGPQDFERNELNATLVASETQSDNEGVSTLTVGLGFGLVVAIALLLYLVVRRDEPMVLPDRTTDTRGWMTPIAPAGNDRGEGSSSSPNPDPPPESEATPEPESNGPFAGVDEELLSDEERVIRLLEAHDGRMKQATIVTETDWSNAKVSQLLSAMAEEGQIEKLRIGRENLISLADED